jgi:hypothetical protein
VKIYRNFCNLSEQNLNCFSMLCHLSKTGIIEIRNGLTDALGVISVRSINPYFVNNNLRAILILFGVALSDNNINQSVRNSISPSTSRTY